MTLNQKNFTAADFEIGAVICHPDLPKDQFEIFAVAQETTACVIHAIEFDDQNPLLEFARDTQLSAESVYSFMTHEMVREIRGQLFRVVFYVPTAVPTDEAFGVERTTYLAPPGASTGVGFEVNIVH